jgi:dUTP pyrophosphatase
MNYVRVGILRRMPEAKMPSFAHGADEDACADICSAEHQYIAPGASVAVDTGLSIALPLNWEAQIRSRSGLSLKRITVANSPGTIDCSYEGPIKVILHNSGDTYFEVKIGDRIAQMAIREVPTVQFGEIFEMPERSTRGKAGFGSTGVA